MRVLKDIFSPGKEVRDSNVSQLDRFLTTDWSLVRQKRDTLRSLSLKLAGFASMQEAMQKIGPKTAIIIPAAGVGSRWKTSIEQSGQPPDTSPDTSRALARVLNLLPRTIFPEDTIPMIAYTLWASRNIPGAKRYVIARLEDHQKIQEVARQLGISVVCRVQEAKNGNMLGHGEAITQNPDILKGVDYVLTQFVGDVSSPTTIQDTLLTSAALKKVGSGVSVLMASTPDMTTAPLIARDERGQVLGFDNARLFGGRNVFADNHQVYYSGRNVSIYVFHRREMEKHIQRISSVYRKSGSYASLPYHGNSTNEFGVNDLIILAGKEGKVRQLCIADGEEGTTTKVISDIATFIVNMRKVIDRQDVHQFVRRNSVMVKHM